MRNGGALVPELTSRGEVLMLSVLCGLGMQTGLCRFVETQRVEFNQLAKTVKSILPFSRNIPKKDYCFTIAAPPRSTYFCTLPVAVLGSSVRNVTLCGALKCARLLRANSRNASSLVSAPDLNTTNACGAS